MKAKIAFCEGRLSDVVEIQESYTDERLERIGESKELVAAIVRNAASAAFLLEDFPALNRLTSVRPSLVSQRDPVRFSEKPYSINGLYLLATGDFRQAREYALTEWQISSQLGLRGPYFSFESLYVLTETSREMGDVTQALQYAELAFSEARQNELWPWVAGFQAKIAYCEFQRGNKALAFEILRKTRDELVRNQVGVETFRIIDEHELVIRSAAKDVSRGKELLARLPKTPTVDFILQTSALSKNSEKIQEELAKLPEEYIRGRIHKLILLAENSGSSSLAQEHAMAALRIGFEFGYQEIFLSRGEVFNQIILDLAATHSLVYLENLATLVRERSFKEISDDSRLTSRELDILRNLATGRPLIQIAKSLHISQNTMKTHLRNVYRKLGADSRDSATKIARDQLLI
jgi:ATP/maltotriose-dependent transcriptional regulator MalT